MNDYYNAPPEADLKGGAKAQSAGRAAEKLVEAMNKRYLADGCAFVSRVSVGFTVESIGTGGRAHGRLKKGPVDFMGIAGGRAIAFDVKSCGNKTSFPLSLIQPHQLRFLDRFAMQGGMAFILLRATVLDSWYVVPVAVILARKAGCGSIRYSDLSERFKAPAWGRGAMPDYLAILDSAAA